MDQIALKNRLESPLKELRAIHYNLEPDDIPLFEKSYNDIQALYIAIVRENVRLNMVIDALKDTVEILS